MTSIADVAIVGAGPIGIELHAACKRAGLRVLHLEAGQVGQTITWYPKQVRYFSSAERLALAGVALQTADGSKPSREEYLAYLRAVVLQFELEIRTGERVVGIERAVDPEGAEGGTFAITTETATGPREYECRAIVLAIGDMHRPRRLGIPGEELPHVSHYFHEPHDYFQKRLLVVGGKNSAVENAIRCTRTGAHVTISYRGAEFPRKSVKYWLLPEIEGLIRRGEVQFLPRTTPVSIEPDQVVLATAEGDETTVAADAVLLMTGYVQDKTLFPLAGVELAGEGEAPVFDPETMETGVRGIYVAGTAAAGTQLGYRLFIENCHVHVRRIVRHLTGDPRAAHDIVDRVYELPES